MTDDTDDDGCRVCGTHVSISFDSEWPDGRPICWSCLWDERTKLAERVEVLERACAEHDREICQTLGKALGLPRYCDDQANFPGATEDDGVCIVDSDWRYLAESAAKRINVLEEFVREFKAAEQMPEFAPAVELTPRQHTYDSSYGGGDCTKYGRWYGVCHSCNRETRELQQQADRSTFRLRNEALNLVSAKARDLLAQCTEGQAGGEAIKS